MGKYVIFSKSFRNSYDNFFFQHYEKYVKIVLFVIFRFSWIREAQANINTFKSTFYKDFRDSKVQKFLHPLGDKNLAFKKLESCVNICFSV